jgi:integrase
MTVFGVALLLTKITAASVRDLLANPPAKDTSLFDVLLPRFAFRAKPSRRPGARPAAWFFVRYTAPDGRERRVKVGNPDTMSVDEARKAARAVLAVVDAGGDPKATQERVRAVPTIRELAARYLASPEFAAKTAKVQSNDQARIDMHIIYRVGGEKADAVTARVARQLRHQIATDTRRNSRRRQLGGAGASRKALRLLATMLRWAKDEGLITSVPFNLRELNLGGDGSRETTITTQEEYARLFTTMDGMVAQGVLRREAHAFITLIAATGLRRGEAHGLRWSQVDLGQHQIRLNGSKGAMLAQRRGGATLRSEIVGLPEIAASALAELKAGKFDPDGLVFAPLRGEQLSINRDWITVRKAARLPPELTLHGLRHSVGTVGAIAGMTMPELQALLRHRQPGTTARYIHFAQASGALADRAMGGVLPASPRSVR